MHRITEPSMINQIFCLDNRYERIVTRSSSWDSWPQQRRHQWNPRKRRKSPEDPFLSTTITHIMFEILASGGSLGWKTTVMTVRKDWKSKQVFVKPCHAQVCHADLQLNLDIEFGRRANFDSNCTMPRDKFGTREKQVWYTSFQGMARRTLSNSQPKQAFL